MKKRRRRVAVTGLRAVYSHNTEVAVHALRHAASGLTLLAQFLVDRMLPDTPERRTTPAKAALELKRACRWLRTMNECE